MDQQSSRYYVGQCGSMPIKKYVCLVLSWANISPNYVVVGVDPRKVKELRFYDASMIVEYCNCLYVRNGSPATSLCVNTDLIMSLQRF